MQNGCRPFSTHRHGGPRDKRRGARLEVQEEWEEARDEASSHTASGVGVVLQQAGHGGLAFRDPVVAQVRPLREPLHIGVYLQRAAHFVLTSACAWRPSPCPLQRATLGQSSGPCKDTDPRCTTPSLSARTHLQDSQRGVRERRARAPAAAQAARAALRVRKCVQCGKQQRSHLARRPRLRGSSAWAGLYPILLG